MCGIAGGFFKSSKDGESAVQKMCARMRNRGPDAEGFWNDGKRLCLGHRRLAIIDLDRRADQPMVSPDGRFVITFNGEIYNYRELRRDLIEQGVTFRTQSDTEVVVELYRLHGVGAFNLLRGMFALAIWDNKNGDLVLARDPYGIKPLYIAKTSHGQIFASQVKSLLETGIVSRASDQAGVVGFYLWGSVPEPFTIYADIKSLPAGSYVILTENGMQEPIRYADIASMWQKAESLPIEEMIRKVRAALTDSVRAHLLSDVPVAILLSGGVDSSAIAGLATEFNPSIEGITITFDEFFGKDQDEGPGAKVVAEHFGIRSTLHRVSRSEFYHDVSKIFDAMDQPTIDGVNTWFATKAVAERGYKVALSGIGGDELFCGYSSFREVPRLRRIGQFIPSTGIGGAVANRVCAYGARVLNYPKLAGIPGLASTIRGAYQLRRGLLMPSELTQVMDSDAAREGLDILHRSYAVPAEPLEDIAYVGMLESTLYLRNQLLRDSDWTSMAHSVELRTPLVDWHLLQSVGPHIAAVADAGGKRLLAGAPQRALSKSFASRQKTGFGTPMDDWLQSYDSRRGALPKVPGKRWSRRWMAIVADEFGFLSKNPNRCDG